MTALVPIVAVAMAPDMSWAVAVREDGTVWERTGALGDILLRSGDIDADKPVAVTLSGSPRRVLWTTGETLKLYGSSRYDLMASSVLPVAASIRALALSPSGNLAVVAFSDATLRTLNVPTWQLGTVLAAEAVAAQAVAIASDEGPVVAVFADGSIRCYDLEARTPDSVGGIPRARFVAITPDGEIVIISGTDGIVWRWNRRLGSHLDALKVDKVITAIAVDGTGNKVLVGRANGLVRLYDLTRGSAVNYPAATAAHSEPRRGLSVPDEERAADEQAQEPQAEYHPTRVGPVAAAPIARPAPAPDPYAAQPAPPMPGPYVGQAPPPGPGLAGGPTGGHRAAGLRLHPAYPRRTWRGSPA
jgi:hypothetical protein